MLITSTPSPLPKTPSRCYRCQFHQYCMLCRHQFPPNSLLLDNRQGLYRRTQLHIYGSPAERYPSLDKLCLRGYLWSGILAVFPNVTQLVVRDAQPSTKLRGTFDIEQPGSSTLLPKLKHIYVLPRYKQEVQDFLAVRRRYQYRKPKKLQAHFIRSVKNKWVIETM